MSEWNQGRSWYRNNWSSQDENTYQQPSNNYYADQYVGFNEFISQMQQNGQFNTSNYSQNGQYNTFMTDHNEQQPIQSQTFHSQTHDPNSFNQYNGVSDTNYVHVNNGYFASNLTPTAVEFVPKNSNLWNANSQDNPFGQYAASSSRVGAAEQFTAVNTSSADRAELVNDTTEIDNTTCEDNTNKPKTPKAPTTEDVGRTFYKNKSKLTTTNATRNKKQDARQDDRENSNRDNYRERRENQNHNSIYNAGSSNARESDSYRQNYSTPRDNGKNKKNTSEYYNRDSRELSRSKFGTQRFQRSERNLDEDEQYANNYIMNREDRQDPRRPVLSEKLQLIPASPTRNKSYKRQDKEESCELTQRERLSEQLDRGVLECLVCCDRVRQADAVWSCTNCYHVLHLRCIRKWATSSHVERKWRCPACQNTSESVPMEYWCFCGAMRSPEWVRGATGAHSCGDRCQRPRACVHPCVLPCHPGPCPPCQATLNKKCGCGAETRAVVCSSKLEQTCARACGKQLDCGAHACSLACHEGACEQCTHTVRQVCHCPSGAERTVACAADTSGAAHWACGAACGRVLACGRHVCRAACHPPACAPCALSPEAVLTCPCGKMRLGEKDKRESCTDPIPLCGNICAKPLACGPAVDLHFCKLECHDGACPPCPDKTQLSCRCGHTSREVDCVELPNMIDNVFCTKKCNKKLSCGRHRCRELCCAAESHRCVQPCGRALSCGLHRCDALCHTGHCAPCSRLGFTELRCECGAAVALPPVACGARPPACSEPCGRRRACGHPPHHPCHAGDCPPCVVLSTKRCHGGHEERKTIPCHQEEFSCGLPCGKPLPCGQHVCIKLCHTGDCATSKCVQQCAARRPGCGHPCGAPCHAGAGDAACPAPAPCRLLVRATCLCKRRVAEKTCADNLRDYAKAMSTVVASRMQDGSAVDLSAVTRPAGCLITLECDDECRVEARTRQMALALQIRNPDMSSKLAPRYGDLLREWAARDPAFAAHVHARLTDLVQLAKKSKQKTRSHSFPSMNRQKRQFVHELCEHFGCESVAYDAEPNRNVVATADREKSWLPSMSVLEVLEREAGKRRVPGPVWRGAGAAGAGAGAAGAAAPPAGEPTRSSSGWATLTSARSRNPWGARTTPATPAAPITPATPAAPAPPPPIDYFDNPPN